MRIARLCADEKIIGAVLIAGRMPRAVTWLGVAYVRFGNSYRYAQVSTVESTSLLNPDFTIKEKDLAIPQTIKRPRK